MEASRLGGVFFRPAEAGNHSRGAGHLFRAGEKKYRGVKDEDMAEQEETEVAVNYLVSGGVVAYQRAIAHAVGDALAGLLFSQLWYWTGRQPEERQGWFFMTQEQIFAETAITRREQESSRRKLRGLGILEEERRGHPAKLWFRINVRAVIQLVEKTAFRQNGGKRHTRMAENAILGWPKTPCKDGGKRHTSKITSKSSSENSAAPRGKIAVEPEGQEESQAGSRQVSVCSEKDSDGEFGIGADAAALTETLVSHGVGRSVADKLARLKPEICKRCLEYLPYAKCRTTKGAWLANAITQEFGPPAAYEQAVAERRKQEEIARRERDEDARQRAEDGSQRRRNERLIEIYEEIEKRRPEAYSAFVDYLQKERARVEHFARNLSAAGKEKCLLAFDSQERRLELFAEWVARNGSLLVADIRSAAGAMPSPGSGCDASE